MSRNELKTVAVAIKFAMGKTKMISVGIDVSKGKSTVTIMKPGGEILVAPYEVIHTQNSLSQLADKVATFDEEVRIVLESTGNITKLV
jgi:predicted NBD/HSP70 family sugar kinase